MNKASSRGTIMIVDDEVFFREILREILEEEGYEIIAEAANGTEAVEKYSIHHPMLTIVDIYMQGGNGLDTAKEIFSINKDARVIMCTGSGYDDDVKAALEIGAADMILKPFIPEELIETIRKVMEG